ncbi:MOSC N-terminal beta barrel domain-containing protein [Bordetella petrii]|uniref:MOSC N-terminal beta barrel domain-containing protein n=1 Tax=Bordetella petrii TaxID=94624 RepID=UPI001E3912D1|nr:MOSC N-terminal beta barrel domain-containing protein [Bordetella petrii]MCD0504935.1 MOSC domain-containing protein [Bordetella petrii]
MSAIAFQPVAECGETSQQQAQAYHRRWLVANDAGTWLTRALCPRLAEVSTELRLGYLVIKAPGMLRMDIPLDVIEDDDSVRYQILIGEQTVDVVDEGDLAAAWLSNFVQLPCRLLKVHPDMEAVRWPA